MNGTELTALIAFAFFVTFVLGWLMRWAYGGLNRINATNMSEIDDLANRLHEAEQAKDNAESYAIEKERELSNQISQIQAELTAAMDGLGEARREAADLRQRLEGAH